MKRLLPLLALVGAGAAWADVLVEVRDSQPRVGRNLLLLNPGDLFSGVLSLEYEGALSPHVGLTAGFSAWTFHGVFSPPSEPTFTVFSPEFGARLHFIRDAPGGLWVGPYVSAGYVMGRSDGAVFRAWSWGVGAAAGYNFIIGRWFTFQLGAGGGFVDYGDRLVWAPRLKLGVGIAF